MEHFLIALTIGVIAGIIDVIPMIMQKMDRFANLSAFFTGFTWFNNPFCLLEYTKLAKRG